MHNIEDMLVEKNYSKCPLKKRPINYQFVKDDFDKKDNKVAEDLLIKSHTIAPTISEEPENLSLKKDSSLEHKPVVMVTEEDEELINVSDCCEDEGVDVDHTDEDSSLFEEDEEMIDCVDIEDNNGADANTTQAAALAAAAAVAAASAAAAAAASVVVPTPTYPKYGLQPWNFHMSPYTAEFYRTINTPHMAQQISPLRGDLLSPSSPSDSLSSLSPPPPHHYMPGRASSVSPPMRSEIIHRPIGVRHLPPSPPQQQQQTQQQQHQQHQHTVHHRFIHYPLTPYPTHPHQTNPTTAAAYALGYTSHHAPISPAYSESSYYSMRSLTPESLVSSVPEDLSIKHNNSKTGTKLLQKSLSNQQKSTEVKEKLVATPAINGSPVTTGSVTKKDKSTPPRYQCPDCQKSYSTFSGLTKHQQFHCPAAEGNQVKKSFSCKDCDKTYVSLGALKMHIRTHTLPCKCNICGKAFSRPWLLQGHIRTHTGEKPFSCQHCHRAFADRSNLRAHLQTHSDIKKYSCSNCSKTFSRMSLLIKHSEGGCQANNMNNNNIDSPVTIASELNPYALYVDH